MGAWLCSRFAGTDHGGRLDEIVFFPSDDGGRRCFCGPCADDGSLPTCVDGAWGKPRFSSRFETAYSNGTRRLCRGLQLSGMECESATDRLFGREDAQTAFARLGTGGAGGLQFFAGASDCPRGVVQSTAVAQRKLANGLRVGRGIGFLHATLCESGQHRQRIDGRTLAHSFRSFALRGETFRPTLECARRFGLSPCEQWGDLSPEQGIERGIADADGTI